METKELAGCVIFNERGELLLIHRNIPGAVQWELPGGKIKKGETAPEAAGRELREELGVMVEIVRPLGSAEFEQRDIKWLYHWFEAVIADNQQPKIAESHLFDGLGYFALSDLRGREDLSLNTKNLLKVLQ